MGSTACESSGTSKHADHQMILRLLPPVIAEDINTFRVKLRQLKDELSKLSLEAHNNAVGNAVGISSYSLDIARSMEHILLLYRSNISALFFVRMQADPAEVVDALVNFFEAMLELFARFQKLPEFTQDLDYGVISQHLQAWNTFLEELSLGGHSDRVVQSVLYQMVEDVGDVMNRLHKDVVVHLTRAGIPRLKSIRKHTIESMISTAEIAVFFAGVSSNMLLFLQQPQQNGLETAVSVFWYSSLATSICSGVASLMCRSWMRTIFCSVKYQPSPPLTVLLERSPIILLIISAVTFFIGLLAFLFAPGVIQELEDLVIPSVVTALIGAVSSSMALVGVHVAWQVLDTGMDFRQYLRYRLKQMLSSKNKGCNITVDLEKQEKGEKGPTESERARRNWRRFRTKILQLTRGSGGHILRSIVDHAHRICSTSLLCGMSATPEVFDLVDGSTGSRPAALIRCLDFSRTQDQLLAASWDHTSSIVRVTSNGLDWGRQPPGPLLHLLESGLVRQAEWAPSGRFFFRLSGTGALSIVENTGEELETRRRHAGDASIRTAAWIPAVDDLTTTTPAVLVFIQDKRVMKIELETDSMSRHRRQQLRGIKDFAVCGMAVTKDHAWIICIGKSTASRRSERTLDASLYRIRVYKLNPTGQENVDAVCDIPTYKEASHVALASNGKHILVSYGDSAHPQLWEIVVSGDQENSSLLLTHVHTFLSKPKSGMYTKTACIFGGPDETYILRAAKDGTKERAASTTREVHARTSIFALSLGYGRSEAHATSSNRSSTSQSSTSTRSDTSSVTSSSGTSALNLSITAERNGSIPTDEDLSQPGQIFFWDRETGILLHAIDIDPAYGYISALAWSKRDNPWMLVAGTLIGKLLVWKLGDDTAGITAAKQYSQEETANVVPALDPPRSEETVSVAIDAYNNSLALQITEEPSSI